MFYIYSKEGCGFCTRIVEFMESKGIEYTKYQLGEDYTKEEFIEKFGRTTFPQIIHEGNNIGGMKETVKYLVENGHV